MDIKNWKQSPKIQEAKEKLEDEKVRGFMRWGFEIVVTLVLAAMVGIMLFQTVTMQESSMEPTIAVGDRFFINRVFRKPRYFTHFVNSNNFSTRTLHITKIGIQNLTNQFLQFINSQTIYLYFFFLSHIF